MSHSPRRSMLKSYLSSNAYNRTENVTDETTEVSFRFIYVLVRYGMAPVMSSATYVTSNLRK